MSNFQVARFACKLTKFSQKHTVWFGIIHHNLNGCHENWIAARLRLTARSHYFTVCSISTASSYGNYVIRGRERTRILWSWIYDNKGLFIKKNNWIIRRVSKNCCNFWDFGLEDCSTISCVNRRKNSKKRNHPGRSTSISQCLKITEKVAFNIASETSYIWILSR